MLFYIMGLSYGAVSLPDVPDNGEADTLKAWVQEVAGAVQAEVLMTDDADGLKPSADANNLKHQVCKAHVVRNSEERCAELRPELSRDADGSLQEIWVTPPQAVPDCDELLRLMHERQPTPDALAKLEQLHQRYDPARSARKRGLDKESLAYRMRLLTLDRWNLWPRLTLYRNWRGRNGERLDGTNNVTERSIGWRVKKRCRAMRGYKRKAPVLNVSRLMTWAGDFLEAGGADLGPLIA